MDGKDTMSDQANQNSVQWFREGAQVVRGSEDDRDIISWKGPIEQFYQLVHDAIKWRLYQAEQKQRRARVEEPEYLRDGEFLP